MKKYDYDNKNRVALSDKTWRRLKKYKRFYKRHTLEECIVELLDEAEYGIAKEVSI